VRSSIRSASAAVSSWPLASLGTTTPRAGALGDLQVGQDVAAVLHAAGEDPIARAQRDRVERGVPRVRGIVEQGDLAGAVADELGDRRVGVSIASCAASAAS
jgi:hypothetical protein